MSVSPTVPSRRCVAALAFGLVVVAAACGAPPPAVPVSPVPADSPAARPAPAGSTCLAAAGPTSTESTLVDVDTISGAEAAVQLEEAVADAALGQVTVTTADRSGRPTFASVPTADAALVTYVATVDDTLVGVDPLQQVHLDSIESDSAGPTVAATDPGRAAQWGFDTVAFESAAPTGGFGAGVEVAVVDTGVMAGHEDLAGKVRCGAAYLGNSTLQPNAGAVDPSGHGTHVAGTVAATAGNGVGVAGVASRATILPVRVLDAAGNGYDTDVANGVIWAVDQGADVVNLSLAGSLPSTPMQQAVLYAESHGVVVAAAAGNGGPGSAAPYPAVYASTIAVGSIKQNGSISEFSTTGPHVDVVAPGSSIYSTRSGGGYEYKSGTSMATPHVTGLVALMLGADSSLTPAQVRARIEATADDKGSPGRDDTYGSGLVDPVGSVLVGA